MDETTLTRTLQDLAANPPLHPSPSADARRRASRLRRNRRTGAAGLAVVVAAGTVGMLQLGSRQEHSSPANSGTLAWTAALNDPANPNHATTGSVIVMDASTGNPTVAYWQGQHLCAAKFEGGHLGASTCAGSAPSATEALTLQTFGGFGGPETWASVRHDVTAVQVTRPDGTSVSLTPLTAGGFPYAVVATTGKVLSLRGVDRNGRQVGAVVVGGDVLQLRPVLADLACADGTPSGFDAVLPAADDPARCYGLAPAALTPVPKSADAQDDSNEGWVLQVALSDRDAATFGALTQRITSQPAPKNQLALVLDGKVLNAPTIQQAIMGGVFQISGGATPFTQQQAEALATRLRR